MASDQQTGSLRSGPIFLWAALQLAALALGASAVPLWARHPVPREFAAMDLLLLTQICAVTLLFPYLLPNRSTAIAIALIPWPLLQLAGILSSTPQSALFASIMYLTIWVGGLRGVIASFKSRQAISVAVSVASLFTIGGILIAYLRLESSEYLSDPGTLPLFGPALGLLAISKNIPSRLAWVQVSLPGLAAISNYFLKRSLHPAETPPLSPTAISAR